MTSYETITPTGAAPRTSGRAASAGRGAGFELLYAPPSARGGSCAMEWESLPLAPGLSFVSVPTKPAAVPRCSARRRKASVRAQVVLEPVSIGGRARLLAIAPPELRLRVNGLPAPDVAVLQVGDELHAGGGPPLYVTEYRSPRIETPAGELLERACEVCRLPLTPETRVYVCHHCGSPMHLEGPEHPGGDPLTCALLGDCVCETPVATDGGYAWRPEA